MSSILVVNEISTEREEIARALEAEGFTVVQANSAAEAVRRSGWFVPGHDHSDALTGTTSCAPAAARANGAGDRTLIHARTTRFQLVPRSVRSAMAKPRVIGAINFSREDSMEIRGVDRRRKNLITVVRRSVDWLQMTNEGGTKNDESVACFFARPLRRAAFLFRHQFSRSAARTHRTFQGKSRGHARSDLRSFSRVQPLQPAAE
jgi:hypothetical protein